MNVSEIVFKDIEDKVSIKPIGDKVAIIALEGTGAESATESGIVYNDHKTGPVRVLIVAVGEDVKEDITPRDIALWDRTTAMGDHEGFGIIRESSLLAIVDRLEG